MAVLRGDVTDRTYRVVCIALGIALVTAGVIAAITVTGAAWITTACGAVLVVASAGRMVRRSSH